MRYCHSLWYCAVSTPAAVPEHIGNNTSHCSSAVMPTCELRDAVSRLQQTSKCTTHSRSTVTLATLHCYAVQQLYQQTNCIVSRLALLSGLLSILNMSTLNIKTTLFVGNYCFDIGHNSLNNIFPKFP